MQDKIVSIRLRQQDYDKLFTKADKQRRSVGEYVKKLIIEHNKNNHDS